MYWKIVCFFNNILQKISSQKSFLWKSENDHKKEYNPWVLHHCWLIWLWSHTGGMINQNLDILDWVIEVQELDGQNAS